MKNNQHSLVFLLSLHNRETQLFTSNKRLFTSLCGKLKEVYLRNLLILPQRDTASLKEGNNMLL